MQWRKVWQVLKDTSEEWVASRTFELGAALAYYGVFAIAPILIIALAIAGFFFGEESARGQLFLRLQEVVGPAVAQALEEGLAYQHEAGTGWLASLIGVAVLFIGAIGLFSELQSALNAIWDVK